MLPEEFPDAGALEAVVHASPWQTELVPASTALASAERALSEPGRGGASQRLKRGLERLDVDGRCELVLIDCPPAMTPLTMNALVAADAVLVPTQLDFLSVAGLAVLMETVAEVREYDNPTLRYLGIVGTQADERTRHAREIRAQLEQLFGAANGGALCETVIRHSTRVRDAHAARAGRRPVRPRARGQRRLPRARRRARDPRTPGRERGGGAVSAPNRADAGAAVAGLFANSTATGGLATRPPHDEAPARVSARRDPVARLRQGVELAEDDVAFLRSLSRPARTGQPRTLGSKFVATGVLAAAIELLRTGAIDMHGVEAGDLGGDDRPGPRRAHARGAPAHARRRRRSRHDTGGIMSSHSRQRPVQGRIRLELDQRHAQAVHAALSETLHAELLAGDCREAVREVLALLDRRVPGWLESAAVGGEAGYLVAAEAVLRALVDAEDGRYARSALSEVELVRALGDAKPLGATATDVLERMRRERLITRRRAHGDELWFAAASAGRQFLYRDTSARDDAWAVRDPLALLDLLYADGRRRR